MIVRSKCTWQSKTRGMNHGTHNLNNVAQGRIPRQMDAFQQSCDMHVCFHEGGDASVQARKTQLNIVVSSSVCRQACMPGWVRAFVAVSVDG